MDMEDTQNEAYHVLALLEEVANVDEEEEKDGAQLKRNELGVFSSLQYIAMA